MKRTFLLIFLLNVIFPAYASEKILNLYNWSTYLPSSVAQQFTRETGIKINYSTFSSNEEMFAKIKSSPNAGYDVIVPGSEYLQKLRSSDLLLRLDRSKIPNIIHIDPWLLNRDFDPGNHYSVPYFWGTTGLLINKKFFKSGSITHWAQFWDPTFKNKVLIINNPKEVFSVALKVLGYPAYSSHPDQIKKAYEKLLTLLPNIKLFNTDATQTIYIDEDATIGMIWNGDAYIASLSNSNLEYIYPKEGVIAWVDNLCILKNAPHQAEAYQFINFLLRPDIAKELALEIKYSSANKEAVALLPKSMRENRTLYPSHADLAHAEFQKDVGDALSLYLKYWEELKLAS
jgi:spermidine/putrescine transport system substrate-binding protein